MPLTRVTVTGAWVTPTGAPASGLVRFVPVQESPATGVLVADVLVTTALDSTGHVSLQLVSSVEATSLQYLVTELIDGAKPIEYVITPSTDVDLSTAPRGSMDAIPIYLLAASRGAAGGVAPLDGTSHVPAQYLPSGSGVLAVDAADGTIVVTGSAADPLIGVGVIPESKVTSLVADLAGLTMAVAARGLKTMVRGPGWVKTGDISPLPNTGGNWVALSGFEIQLPAVIGDYVELHMNAMRRDATGNSWLDGAVLTTVGGLVRFLASGDATPGLEGDPGWYVPQVGIVGRSAPRGFFVTAGDLDGGNVRFVVAVKSNGTGVMYSSANYPFYWRAVNHGPVS